MAGKNSTNGQAGPDSAPLMTLAEARSTGIFGLARREQTRRERSLQRLYDEQRLTEGLQAEKARYGQQLIGGLHASGVRSFEEMATTIWTVMEQPRPPRLQRYVERYCERSIEVGGAYIHEATIRGSDNILGVIGESIYVQAKPRTFWQRLFNYDDET